MIREIIGDDEIEEGFELGISVPFGGLGIAFCDHLEEMIDVLTADRAEILLPEELLEAGQDVPVA